MENSIALLEHTPAALNALLRGLPKAWTETDEGQGTWSPTMVVAHLVHGEHENWIPRAKLILQFGEAQAFGRFDRDGHIRYSRGKVQDQLLDEFEVDSGTCTHDLLMFLGELEHKRLIQVSYAPMA